MKKAPMQTNSGKRIKVSEKTRALYEARDKSLDNDPDAPTRPPEGEPGLLQATRAAAQWSIRAAAMRVI